MISRRVHFILVLPVAFAMAACTGGEPSTAESESSGISVEIFAPGHVNSTWPEFGIAFSVTGDTVYYNRTNVNRTGLAIMRSIRTDGEWKIPEVAPFSGEFFDILPFVAPDGSIFFSSRRINPDTKAESLDNMLYLANGSVVRLPGLLNSDSTESFVSVTLDGSIVFESNRSGANQMLISRMENGARLDPEPILIPGVREPGNPLIAEDGSMIVFVDAAGESSNLHFSCKVEGGWSISERLPGPINSSYDDFAPSRDRDGFLYFSSQRPGMVQVVDERQEGSRPSDIYKSSLNLATLCAASEQASS
jgi:hypothetical protein